VRFDKRKRTEKMQVVGLVAMVIGLVEVGVHSKDLSSPWMPLGLLLLAGGGFVRLFAPGKKKG
jgi:hypothetical protein